MTVKFECSDAQHYIIKIVSTKKVLSQTGKITETDF